jgi:hypothetical protein
MAITVSDRGMFMYRLKDSKDVEQLLTMHVLGSHQDMWVTGPNVFTT